MLYALAAIAILAVVALPQLWVRMAIGRHGKERPDLPGTGGELARHLLDRLGLDGVRVELADAGDHYDPEARAVRLLPQHHDGRSVAAVAIAAHEVGHAIQHARGERALALRQSLAGIAAMSDRAAALFFIAAPFLALLVRTPLAFAGLLALGIVFLMVRVMFSIVTLPVEFDASYGKALPILQEGRYLREEDMPAARSVLRAAAFTYLAGALITLVNLARWARLLR